MADERPDDRRGNGEGEGSRERERAPDALRDEGQGRRTGRHRGFRGRHGVRTEGSDPAPNEASPEHEPNGAREGGRDMPACPLCGKPVYDLSTAISASRETGEPAHFDCVLERVGASESLASGEKLVYLGSGSFGVVEFKEKNESAFLVKRRIQWEKEGEKKDWRRGLSSKISNL
jgi:hypothetical protein